MSANEPVDISETVRQAVLESYPLDAPDAGAQLDRLARLAARLCNVPVGLVSLVEADRQRFIGRSGTSLAETPREQSFCAHAMLEPEGMVIPNAAQDPRFRDNPLVTGGPAIRFYAGMPLVSQEGIPLGSLCVIAPEAREDLSAEEREGLEALAAAAIALLERWRVERSSDRLRAQSQNEIAHLQQRFEVLADTMPQLVWSATPDGMSDYFNRVWCEFTGKPAEESFGRQWMQFLFDEDKLRAAQRWMEAVESGKDYEVEYRLRHHESGYRWMLARGIPLRDANGDIVRWIGTCTDIQEQKADAELSEVLSRELNHRIKNIFAVIGGLIALTIRNKPEFSAPASELRERILALGRAHDFVRSRGGQPSPEPHGKLSGLLTTLLAPYQDAAKCRVAITGDDVEIDDRSATPLALFFHELATNAAKYGALALGTGRVEIQVEQCEDEVVLVWREHGCLQAGEPIRPGFGTSLIEMSIVRQLGGTLDYDWADQGLRVAARIPSRVLAR